MRPSRPRVEWVKCNVDATFDVDIGKGGFGVVVRDDGGTLVAACACCLDEVCLAFHAELLALGHVICFYIDHHFEAVIF